MKIQPFSPSCATDRLWQWYLLLYLPWVGGFIQIKLKNFLPSWNFNPTHCWYIEPRNREKSLRLIWQRFSCLLDEWIAKISRKKNFTVAFWDNPHYPFWDLRWDLKIFLGYDINYLSIWPFMGHPWFPTRKASKLTFACFQLAGWWPCDCFQLAGWCHSPAS